MSRELQAEWRLHTLSELIKLTPGWPFKSDHFTQAPREGRPLVRIRDLNNQAPVVFTPEECDARYLVKHGDHLIGMDGEFLAVKWSGPEALLNQRVLKITSADERLDRNFLFYRIQPELANIEARTGATTVKHLSTKDILSLQLLIPPLQEQRRIAEILSSVDEAIAATRAVIEQTRKVKQGVLECLLTKGIGHTRLKQMEIGEIPEGWETGKIGDFFTLQRGFDITEKQSTAGEYPVVSSSGISYFHSEAMVHGPAVITGRKGKLGQVHFIDSSCWPHDTTLWVKDFKGNAPKFVYWFLRSLNLEKFDAATAVPTLNRNVVHALRCAFPPVSEQLLISDHLDSIEATEDAQTRNLTAYGQMKSALMSDLLTGRKRVTEAVPMAAE